MSPENLVYWKRGFNYDRSHITNNKVVIEAYRLLMHYCQVHTNCRVGAFLMASSFSKFYSLDQIMENFDMFSTVASEKKKTLSDYYPEYIKEAFGPTLNEQVEKVYQLDYPIYFQFESKNLLKDIVGYKFIKPLSFKIDPNDIEYLRGNSLGSFEIGLKGYVIAVHFRDMITIQSHEKNIK